MSLTDLFFPSSFVWIWEYCLFPCSLLTPWIIQERTSISHSNTWLINQGFFHFILSFVCSSLYWMHESQKDFSMFELLSVEIIPFQQHNAANSFIVSRDRPVKLLPFCGNITCLSVAIYDTFLWLNNTLLWLACVWVSRHLCSVLAADMSLHCP